MGKQLLKHREALLAAVVILMIGAIGSLDYYNLTAGIVALHRGYKF